MTRQLRAIRRLAFRGYTTLSEREENFSPRQYYSKVVRPQLASTAREHYTRKNVELRALTPREAADFEYYMRSLGFTTGQFQPKGKSNPEDDSPADCVLPVEWY